MTTFLRHTGFLRNTGKRIAVVYHQQPGLTENALVIDMEALPQRYHDAVVSLLQSKEAQAQECRNFYDILARRMMPDDGIPMINSLHNRGCLMSVPIDNVVMQPAPGKTIPLRQLLEYMAEQGVPMGPALEPLAEPMEVANDPTQPSTSMPDKFNPMAHNQAADKISDQMALAKSYLVQAQLLETDARKYRDKAYALAPVLRDQEIKADMNSIAQTPKKGKGRLRKPSMEFTPVATPATAPAKGA